MGHPGSYMRTVAVLPSSKVTMLCIKTATKGDLPHFSLIHANDATAEPFATSTART